MKHKKKIKYEKPASIDMGKVAPILGATCSPGSGADACTNGTDPATQPVCWPTGSSATANCETGDSAAKSCGDGNTPGWGCYNGSNKG